MQSSAVQLSSAARSRNFCPLWLDISANHHPHPHNCHHHLPSPPRYSFSPDECIPEFYSDASIFTSLHPPSVLGDIAPPSWCSSPSAFIAYHRNLLEGSVVSYSLNHWIDLNFGSSLSGDAAVRQKNVPLHLNSWGPCQASPSVAPVFGGSDQEARRPDEGKGFVQLFKTRHPSRVCTSGGIKVNVKRRTMSVKFEREAERNLSEASVRPSFEALDFRGAEADIGESSLLNFVPLSNNAAADSVATNATPPSSGSAAQAARRDGNAAGSVADPLVPSLQSLPQINLPSFLVSDIGKGIDDVGEEAAADGFGKEYSELFEPTVGGSISPLQSVGYLARDVYRSANIAPPIAVQAAVDALSNEEVGDFSELVVGCTEDAPLEDLLYSKFRHLFTKEVKSCYEVLKKLKDRGSRRRSPQNFFDLDVDEIARIPAPAFNFLQAALLKPFELGSWAPTKLESTEELVKVIPPYANILGRKMGCKLASKVLLRKIIAYLEDLEDVKLRNALLWSPLIPSLYHLTCGSAFLTQVLPYLMAILKTRGEEEAKRAVVSILIRMSQPENLGSGLTARYIVPALVVIVGNLRLHEQSIIGGEEESAGKNGNGGGDDGEVDVSHMHAAHALASIIPHLPEDSIGLGVCEPLFNNQIPRLQEELQERVGTGGATSAASALIEVIYVLHASITNLSADMVFYHYLERPPLPCHQLLLVLLTLIGNPLHGFGALVEAGSLLSSVCLCVARTKVVENVLPALDTFFGFLHDAYQVQLSEGSQKSSVVDMSKESLHKSETSRRSSDIVDGVMALRGMEIGKDLYDTCVGVVGDDSVMAHKCARANMLLKWFQSGRKKGAAEAAKRAKENSASAAGEGSGNLAGSLGLARGFSWIRKRVRTHSSSVDYVNMRQSSGDGAEVTMLDPLGVGDGIKELIGKARERGIENIGFVDSAAVVKGNLPSGMSGLVMDEYFYSSGGIGGSVELQESSALKKRSKKSEDEAAFTDDDDFYRPRVSAIRILSDNLEEEEEDEAEEDEAEEEEEEEEDSDSGEEMDVNTSSSGGVAARNIAHKLTAANTIIDETAEGRGAGVVGVEGRVKEDVKEDANKRRFDRTWLMGSSSVVSNSGEPWKKVGKPWPTHMVLLSSLKRPAEAGKVSGIRAMATNPSESLVVTGGRNGEVLIWDIASHPPVFKYSHKGHRIARAGEYFRPEKLELYDEGPLKTGEVLQLDLTDHGGQGIICDGNISVFDVETNQTLAILKRNCFNYNYFGAGGAGSDTGWDASYGLGSNLPAIGNMRECAFSENDPLVAFKALGSGGSRGAREILAISSDRLVTLDLRERVAGGGRELLRMPCISILRDRCQACAGLGAYIPRKLCKRHHHKFDFGVGGSWLVGGWESKKVEGSWEGSGSVTDAEGHRRNTCICVQEEENWVCVGSNDGKVICMERRAGRVLCK